MDDLRQRLEEILQRRPESPADAERAAQAAEALASYLRLGERVRQLLDEGGPEAHQEPRRLGAEGLKGMTLHGAAEQVLRQAGVPLHVRELAKRIKAGGWTHKRSVNPRPDQILYQLAARLPRFPDVFVRVAPNTFGLKEWAHSTNERPRPRIALFCGKGKPSGRDIGERSDVAAGAGQWRSS